MSSTDIEYSGRQFILVGQCLEDQTLEPALNHFVDVGKNHAYLWWLASRNHANHASSQQQVLRGVGRYDTDLQLVSLIKTCCLLFESQQRPGDAQVHDRGRTFFMRKMYRRFELHRDSWMLPRVWLRTEPLSIWSRGFLLELFDEHGKLGVNRIAEAGKNDLKPAPVDVDRIDAQTNHPRVDWRQRRLAGI